MRRRFAPPGRDDLDRLSADPEITSNDVDLETECRRLAGALATSSDGVIVVDTSGAEVFRNTAAERYRDARHADALAKDVIDRLLADALVGEANEEELALFGPPREVVRVRAAPLGLDDGPLVGAVAFVHDISEARRVESVRRDFVANVSHELKTPIGALGLLAETIASADDLTVMHQLSDQLVQEAERLARIVDDLLDLSLIEAQEAPIRQQVPVHVILGEAVDRLGPMALANGIPIEVVDVAPDLDVICDPKQLVSAVTNLLDNSVKYSEPGERVELRAERDGDRVVLAVRDHGIGIPRVDLERIFERFYRVDKARSRATGGTGLGLSIVRHIVQAHGGEVTVESVEGEGSTFYCTLPLATDAVHRRAVAGERT